MTTEGDIRSLAVEIVDYLAGHTIEFSNQPAVHEHDYDWVEQRLAKTFGALPSSATIAGRLYMADMTPVPLDHPVEWLRGKVTVGYAVGSDDLHTVVTGSKWRLEAVAAP